MFAFDAIIAVQRKHCGSLSAQSLNRMKVKHMNGVRKAEDHGASGIGAPAPDPHVSIPKAAEEIGMTPWRVKSLVLTGELVSAVSAGRSVITRASLDAFKARRAQEQNSETTAR